MKGTNSYRGEAERYAPRLEASYDEIAALVKASKDGDEASFTKLFEGHYWVIRAVMRQHGIPGTHPNWDSIFACGKIGFLNAFRDYDPDNEKHMPLFTFAMLPVWNEIFKGFKDDIPFSLSKGDYEDLSRIKNFYKEYELKHNCLPAVSITAYALGLKEKTVERLMELSDITMCSLDAPLSDDNRHTVSETVSNGSMPIDMAAERSDRNEIVRYCVGHVLDVTERTIISRNFGLNGEPETLSVIADSMGLKLDKVKSIRAKAMLKLKKALNDYER